ncbi:MAG: long-chain-fatty-acid--CoA ligase [Deltaproteobacteria bacterium]|nr:long-chain-fatty-acid--CoA ligase [Deltaproteobacteria bacterium]
MNTTDFLDIAVAICPERECIVFEGERFTFQAVNERVNRLAHWLRELGVGKGDRVGMMQVNCHHHVEAYLAAAKLGAIYVPLNYRLKESELEYALNHAAIKVLLAGERYRDLVLSIRDRVPTLEHVILVDGSGRPQYEEALAAHPADEVPSEIADDDVTILLYTSGTTGHPKGVPLRHDAFVLYALENVSPADPDSSERTILTVPLYHVAGIQAMFPAIYGGRTLVMMRQFELEEWMATVECERVTRAMLVPTMLKWIVEKPDLHRYDLSSLQVITYGAAPMPFEVIKKAIEAMPWVQFINGYGQTESASTLTTLGPADHRIEGTEEEKAKKWKRLQSSIGRPLPDVQIRIVDDEGKVLAANEKGEIHAKGPRIMSGYWGDAAKTAQTLTTDGWLRTGDVGYVDEEGYVYLTGRADDLIIRGGENIAPGEIEEVIDEHPKVYECCVIPVPDEEFGAQPFVYCVLKENETCSPEEIMEFCRERIAGYKRPRGVAFIDSLPRNPMGKLLRRQLTEHHGQTR